MGREKTEKSGTRDLHQNRYFYKISQGVLGIYCAFKRYIKGCSMFKKLPAIFFTVLFTAAFMLTSCKQNSSCLMCPAKIRLTPTQTATPDASYSVYIHQAATPAASVSLTLYSEDRAITLTAATNGSGIAGFKVNNGGKWTLTINSFNGFDSNEFEVDPVGTTNFAVDYGIPSLDLQLVSGSETIPINASTIGYRLTYHTKYPRFEGILVNIPDGISSSLPAIINMRKENDIINFTININKSFENYQIISPTASSLIFTATGKASGIADINSNARTLSKDWIFNVDVEFHYMAIYDCADNGGHTSFYAGIRNIDVSRSTNCKFAGALQYEATDAANEGSAGMNTPVLNTFNALLKTLGFGDFNVEAKIPTSAGWNYAASANLDNNGWMTVRFHDGANLDVKRTFSTNNGWGQSCADYDCLYSGIPSGDTHHCGTIPPGGACGMGTHFEPRYAYRERTGNINVTY